MVDPNCSICKGTGLISIAESAPCAACESTGKVLGNDCVWCSGTGRNEIKVQTFCPKCNPEAV